MKDEFEKTKGKSLFGCNEFLRSFCLIKKNQKIKAYTPAATNSLRSAKISENSLRSNTEIFLRSTWNLLHASFVRPV